MARRKVTTNLMAVQSFLDDLVITPKMQPLATLALTLAAKLDNPVAGMAVAPIAKELRATLADLAPAMEDRDDLLDALRAPMGDAKD